MVRRILGSSRGTENLSNHRHSFDTLQKSLSNIYASPSLLITSRSIGSPSLIRAISIDKLLVESDSHDVRLSANLVWGAVEWIGRCKAWQVEGLDGEEVRPWNIWDEDGESEQDEECEVRIVRVLEMNWARFMRLTT